MTVYFCYFRVYNNHMNCSKKVWNFTFALHFCTYSFIIFTRVLHVLKDCSFPYIL